MEKFMFWEEYKRWYSDDSEVVPTMKDVYLLSTIALCCNIINGTVISKLPGYVRRKSKV